MRAAFKFLVPHGRRAPFVLTAKRGKHSIGMKCPIVRGSVTMPVQGVFRASVEELVRIGAVLVPNSGTLPAAESAPAPKAGKGVPDAGPGNVPSA